MRNFGILAAATCLALFSADRGAADGVVVELYTSQGCSSCPPADALLSQLAAREDVIALSLHVDYWDYLGWKDELADPSYTERQRAYARHAGSTMIYTPQMVVGGRDMIVGTKAMVLADHIQRQNAAAKAVDVDLSRRGDRFEIRAQVLGVTPQDMKIQLVRFKNSETVEIRRGENAGKTITYHNVVTSWETIGGWNGKSPLELAAPAEGEAPAVVIVQDGTSGPILAAARLD
ncbi:MAG: DUF1223 domain-containing protein [Litoreibacter sp.]|nr:DUF1223 domain-containing protein [Litoreibacter sp.]